MEKIIVRTTGQQQEFCAEFMRKASSGIYPEAARQQEESFKRNLKVLEVDKEVAVCVTTLRELHLLNGLSTPVGGKEEWHNLAVPNFLADRLGLEPLGHELGLEVFGQGLHYTAPLQVENGFVICTICCTHETGNWDRERKLPVVDPYHAYAIRLQQEKYGFAQLYPTSHVARSSDHNLLLYKEKKDC